MKKREVLYVLLAIFFVGCGSPSGFKSIVTVVTDNNNSKDTPTEMDDNTSKNTDQEVDDNTLKDLEKKVRASTVQIKIGNRKESKWGTGFFINAEGYIITSNNVATGGFVFQINIKGEEIYALPVGYAECANLAVIKLISSTNNYLDWYDDYATPTSHVAVASFTEDIVDSENRPTFIYNKGVVHTVSRQISTPWVYTEAFDHSAFTTVGGHLGGPVVDVATGKVVGMHYAGSEKSPNRKYAISGIEAKALVNRMINGENIYSIGISPEVSLSNSGKSLGVRVKNVVVRQHADRIGIKTDDLIIGLGGESLTQGIESRVATLERYCSVLRTHNPNNPDDTEDRGDIVSIKIQRFTQDDKWVTCQGEINGDSLTLADDSNAACPK